MSIWLECVIGTLAAIGFICILKAVYDIIFTGYSRSMGACELYLYGKGADPETERLLCAACEIRKLYLPRLAIIFVEEGGPEEEQPNYARALCARRDIEYRE